MKQTLTSEKNQSLIFWFLSDFTDFWVPFPFLVKFHVNVFKHVNIDILVLLLFEVTKIWPLRHRSDIKTSIVCAFYGRKYLFWSFLLKKNQNITYFCYSTAIHCCWGIVTKINHGVISVLNFEKIIHWKLKTKLK